MKADSENRLVTANRLTSGSTSREIEQAISAWPENFLLHERLGDCIAASDPARARKSYKKALTLEPRAVWLNEKIKRLNKQVRILQGGRGSPLKPRISSKSTKKVSLVTCVRDREQNFVQSLATWLAVAEISEIVVVDWSSEIPISEVIAANKLQDRRIKVVRVDDEPAWVLSEAYNLGFRCSAGAVILKVDADVELKSDVLHKNPIEPGTFQAGNWRTYEDDSQHHLNGTFFVKRADLAKVGGFNENISTYGFDDDELYERLCASGLIRVDLDSTTLFHQPHDDTSRGILEGKGAGTIREKLMSSDYVNSLINQRMNDFLPPWHRGKSHSKFVVRNTPKGIVAVRDGARIKRVSDDIQNTVQTLVLGQILGQSYRFDAASLSTADLHALLDRPSGSLTVADLMPKQMFPAANVARRNTVFIDAQHGLGNRMRAIGSAAEIARLTDRELVIVWQADEHCDCAFGDLFDGDIAVQSESFYAAAQEQGMQTVNYMEAETDGDLHAPLRLHAGKDLYLRSQSNFKTSLSQWADENAFLRSLAPVAAVKSLVESVRHPNDISVHIRMVGGSSFEHLAYEGSENWNPDSHVQIDNWRKLSGYQRFIPHLEKLIAQNKDCKIFVAADLQESYDALQDAFGPRICYLQRNVFDRSKEQIQYALADAILLGRADVMLGSGWSSFTELAQRLSPNSPELYISGVDF